MVEVQDTSPRQIARLLYGASIFRTRKLQKYNIAVQWNSLVLQMFKIIIVLSKFYWLILDTQVASRPLHQ